MDTRVLKSAEIVLTLNTLYFLKTDSGEEFVLLQFASSWKEEMLIKQKDMFFPHLRLENIKNLKMSRESKKEDFSYTFGGGCWYNSLGGRAIRQQINIECTYLLIRQFHC